MATALPRGQQQSSDFIVKHLIVVLFGHFLDPHSPSEGSLSWTMQPYSSRGMSDVNINHPNPGNQASPVPFNKLSAKTFKCTAKNDHKNTHLAVYRA